MDQIDSDEDRKKTVSTRANYLDAKLLPNGEPVLRMPFPAETVVLCMQGNCSPEGYSHHWSNCRHALDLSSLQQNGQQIVAAADGKVVQVYDKSDRGDSDAGNGFGNYVKILHNNGFFTMYSHLETVTVKEGQQIKAGATIGIMGNTGRAGTKHLHFSLHKGEYDIEGTGATVPMHALIAADMSGSGEFAVWSSLEFIGAGAKVSNKGHLYASENGLDQPTTMGKPTSEISAKLSQIAENMEKTIGGARTEDVHEILSNWHDVAEVKNKLETIVKANPEEFEAWYWIAVANQRDLGDLASARTALMKIVDTSPAPSHPDWLMGWTYLRLGQIDAAQGKKAEAIKHLKMALMHEDNGINFTKKAKASLKAIEEDSLSDGEHH